MQQDRNGMALFKRIAAAAGAAGASLMMGYAFEALRTRLNREARLQARGRLAASPLDMPWLGWKDVLSRFVSNLLENRIPSLAGAVAFFTLLSLVPALSLFVTIYRYFTDPGTIATQLYGLTLVLPEAGRELIREQAVLSTDPEHLSQRIDEISATLGSTGEWIADQQKTIGAMDDLISEPPPLSSQTRVRQSN
jgi:hypothetical protein